MKVTFDLQGNQDLLQEILKLIEEKAEKSDGYISEPLVTSTFETDDWTMARRFTKVNDAYSCLWDLMHIWTNKLKYKENLDVDEVLKVITQIFEENNISESDLN